MRSLTGPHIWPDQVSGLGTIWEGEGQLYNGTGVVVPDLRCVDPVRLRVAFSGQEKVDRAARRMFAIFGGSTPCFDEPPTFGVRSQIQCFDDVLRFHGPLSYTMMTTGPLGNIDVLLA